MESLGRATGQRPGSSPGPESWGVWARQEGPGDPGGAACPLPGQLHGMDRATSQPGSRPHEINENDAFLSSTEEQRFRLTSADSKTGTTLHPSLAPAWTPGHVNRSQELEAKHPSFPQRWN